MTKQTLKGTDMSVREYENFIDGQFVKSQGARIEVSNPANGQLLSTIPDSTDAELEAAVAAAKSSQRDWGLRPAIERANYLRQIAAKIRENVEPIARIITEEQGKVLGLAEVEVNFTADYIDYMAEWARRIEGEIIPSDRAGENIFLFRQPIGIIGGILPWNFPFFLIARKMAPALVTGNTIVIKPSEETPNNAGEFCKIVAETDLPNGIFNVVHGSGRGVGNALTSHTDIGMISFTGSVETGSRIMQTAAKNITKVNLELGGKAPALVLADADIDLAVNAIKNSRVINTGQVCNCAERVYVDRKVANEFIDKLSAAMQGVTYGDPIAQPDVDMGPLVNEVGLNKVAAMVDRARSDGANIVTGGAIADLGQGYHYQPTVIADCNASMEIMNKEIFGPVMPIQTVDDIDEAIALANQSEYGLTSSIYTRDIGVAMRACNEIKFGETYINRENFEAMQGYHAGVRKSGIGGADGKHGLYEFMQTHVVYIQN